jgi:hypothetical protein
MWSTDNRTPFRVVTTWGRDVEGVHEWIVAVKATYQIQPDSTLTLASEQLDPLLLAEFNGDPGASSLRYDADVVSPKPTTDIVLNGTAYAPAGRPAAAFEIGLKAGSIQKVLRVRGDRVWVDGRAGGSPSSVQPVMSVPIVYERAYGGYDNDDPDPRQQRIDLRNPVGIGISAKVRKRVGQPMPNFEYLSGQLERDGPAGFGAVASHWSPRLELNGTYDDEWQRSRFPLLPSDWDPRSLLCSPVDQRPATHLRGGETIELFNLTPQGALCFVLPKVYLRFRTLIDKRMEEHPGSLGTVIIEPDQRRVMMVWQSALRVRGDGEYLEETIVSEKVRVLF